jgi:ribosomal protein L13E
VPFKILSGGQTVQAAGGAGKETETSTTAGISSPDTVQRLAAVERFQPGKGFTCASIASASFSRHSARVFGVVCPSRKSPIGRLNRRVDLRR